jgi:hypothetical protein
MAHSAIDDLHQFHRAHVQELVSGRGLKQRLFPPFSRRHLTALALREAIVRRAPFDLPRLATFAVTARVTPDNFYVHGLRANWDRRNDYLFNDEMRTVIPAICRAIAAEDWHALGDKRTFAARCIGAGLPVPQTLAEYCAGREVSFDADASYERDLFAKFTDRYCGDGAMALAFVDGKHQTPSSRLALPELRRYLADHSARSPVLLQPRYFNCDELKPISGSALATVRVVTAKPKAEKPEVILAALRMGTGNAVADNFVLGGIAAPIDVATGRLGPASGKGLGRPLESHPDTGARIAGRQIPSWHAVLALALAAHDAFPTMPTVGWDVALIEGGHALLLEGNSVWGVDVAQISHAGPLADTRLPAILAEYIEGIG